MEMKELGAGTEKLEHELQELLPQARLLRMDSDTTSGKGSHNRILKQMAEGTADILIGTQMITKGHDFPGVTLVGVINGEASLNMPDFRSSERTFQILSQVFGRPDGRHARPVLLQSVNPGHYAIQCAINHDSNGFYQQEMEFRSEAGYPPFSYLACIGFSGTTEQGVEQRAEYAAELLQKIKRELKLRVDVLGPPRRHFTGCAAVSQTDTAQGPQSPGSEKAGRPVAVQERPVPMCVKRWISTQWI
jgi:primosomal protein N' (replication factor Y)